MGKRKQNAPARSSEEKQRCMTWNMQDLRPDGTSFDIVPDNDPSLALEELLSSQDATEANENDEQIIDTDFNPTESDVERLFQENLTNCLFYISLYDKVNFKESDWHCELGTFHLQIFPSTQNSHYMEAGLPTCKECWLYVSDKPGKSMLYYEIEANSDGASTSQTTQKAVYFTVKIDMHLDGLRGLQLKTLSATIGSLDMHTSRVGVTVYGGQGLIKTIRYPSEAFARKTHIKKSQISLSAMMEKLYGVKRTDYGPAERSKVQNIDELYDVVKKHHQEHKVECDIDVQHPNLIPQLRPYQKEGIKWMLRKERYNVDKVPKDDQPLHILYDEITTRDGKRLFYNRHGGWLVQDRPLAVRSAPGGLLADEMGLGKTVEVLACMLLHPRTDIIPPEPLAVMQDEITYIETSQSSFASSFYEDEDEIKTPMNTASGSFEMVDQSETVMRSHDIDADQLPSSELETIAEETVYSVTLSNDCIVSESLSHDTEADQSDTVIRSHDTVIRSHDTVIRSHDTEADQLPSSEGETKVYKTLTSVTVSNDCIVRESLSMGAGNIRQFDKIDFPIEVVGMDEAVQTIVCSIAEKKFSTNLTEKSEAIQTEMSSLIRHTNANGDSDIISVNLENVVDQTINVEMCHQPTLQNDVIKKSVRKKKKNNENKSFAENPQQIHSMLKDQSVTQKEYFECICGATNEKWKKHVKVQCTRCTLWQHAHCVNYDLNDPYRGDYRCPHCHVSSPPIPSKATLIISPNSICHQWVEEISKHIRKESLKVYVYTGVNKLGFVQPQTLANCDIVITTYETLRKEIDYVDLPHSNSELGRRFRHPKRFMAVPSPIVAVEWWRVCLDEAQMVECTTTKTADMALRLNAVNRWCVTGTPIQKGVEDLYGLLLFLGVDPYWVQTWWDKLLYEPYCHGNKEPLHRVVSEVLWRTAKVDILDQIQIPKQTESVHWLTFSPVEDHFYRRQYRKCAQDTLKDLGRYTDSSKKLSTLDRHTLHLLLMPLLRLRQACCHPQAVRGEFLPIHKTTMTMEELLESLTKKARLECEESHRQVVAALNGQAALHIIRGEYIPAVEFYREVLRSVVEYREELRTDPLQQLHAMHNLGEILSTKPDGVDPTLRDGQLAQQCDELRDKYLAKVAVKVTASQELLISTQQAIRDQQREFQEVSDWWIDVLQWSLLVPLDDVLMLKVREDLLNNANPELNSIAYRFKDIRGLEYIVNSQLVALESSHQKLLAAVMKLSIKPSRVVVNQTVDCCLRPLDAVLKTCPYCKADELFSDYESKLFSFVEKGVTMSNDADDSGHYQVSTKRQGTWAESELEKSLKSILSFSRSHNRIDQHAENGGLHIKLFDALKKEFRQLRAVWMSLREQVSSIDELDMATTRIRERLPDEPQSEIPQPNVIEPVEFNHYKMKFVSDKTIGLSELRKKLGQLLYLKNLAKNQEAMGTDGSNPEPCPVCQKELGKEWSVLQCGHCFCLDCIRIMVDHYSFGGMHHLLKCAICRERTHRSEISYVSTKGQDEEAEDGVRVKGSHSTKVDAIVRCLMKIHRDDPSAKALVFSSWQDVLDVIARALSDNDVTFQALHAGKKFQKSLTSFKSHDDVTALLLPVHSGANGLNLIEATHVLLVEPILNPSEELQAIGRVHRIGQTSRTEVHRFLVRGTIEQRMHTILQSFKTGQSNMDAKDNSFSIGDLTALFRENRGDEQEVEGTDGNN